jgi:hypothetical protein
MRDTANSDSKNINIVVTTKPIIANISITTQSPFVRKMTLNIVV